MKEDGKEVTVEFKRKGGHKEGKGREGKKYMR